MPVDQKALWQLLKGLTKNDRLAYFLRDLPLILAAELPRLRVRIVKGEEMGWEHLVAACSFPTPC
jgi:hypothetical protein